MTISAILIFHIVAGSVGLIAGAAALFSRKGASLHRTAGNVFFISMILMAVSGGVVAVFKPAAAAFNIFVAALTIYMVATSWLTVVRPERAIGAAEIGGLLAALAIAVGAALTGQVAAGHPDGLDGMPDFLFYAFAGIAALAALADASVIARRGIAGAQRIARHLWRMCAAFLLGNIAFFVGQGAKIFPDWVQEAGLLPVPVFLVLALTLFWLVRVLATGWYAKQASAAAGG